MDLSALLNSFAKVLSLGKAGNKGEELFCSQPAGNMPTKPPLIVALLAQTWLVATDAIFRFECLGPSWLFVLLPSGSEQGVQKGRVKYWFKQ